MAIKLRVSTTQARFRVGESDPVRFGAHEGIPIYPADYQGAYTVTPTQQTQTLPTEGLMMTQDVTVNPIPSNYGLITWTGSVLIVS